MSGYAFTDKNVPLNCSECDMYLEGIDDTVLHLTKDHDYTPKEAREYAQDWIELAHDQQREQLSDYYADAKIDRAIERDAFPNK